MAYFKYAPTLISIGGNFKGNQRDANLSPVTPSDTVDLPNGIPQGFLVTAAGNVAVNMVGGGTALFTGLVAGQMVACNCTRILTTNTTASVSASYL